MYTRFTYKVKLHILYKIFLGGNWFFLIEGFKKSLCINFQTEL
jgi:hypothetical protein